MQTQALFKGLTRPAMLFGVPIIPLFFSLGITIFITISTQLFYIILFYIPLYVLMKQMTKQDNFIFRLYFFKVKISYKSFIKEISRNKILSSYVLFKA